MFCITSRRYGDNAKQHRFYYIFKLSSVFFHMFDRLFYIMIMNRLCEGRMLKCIKQSLDLFPFQQWKQLLFLVMKIIGIVKGLLLFVYINNKKLSLLFCKIRQKNRMHLSAVCFNFAQHNNEQTLHTLKNTGFKQPVWAGRYRTEHIWG